MITEEFSRGERVFDFQEFIVGISEWCSRVGVKLKYCFYVYEFVRREQKIER